MKLLISGEGRTELGGYYDRWVPGTQADDGTITALLGRVAPEGWEVAEAVQYKSIRKYAAGGHRSAEKKHILGLALRAHGRGHDGYVFVRDSDGDPQRVRDVESAYQEAQTAWPHLRAVGGVAEQATEAWILALRGCRGSQEIRHPKAALQEDGVKGTAAIVEVIETADLDAIPDDAVSLHTWLDRARAALATQE